MWIKAKHTFIKTVYSPRSYGGPYMQAKHADVCSGVMFWTACTRRPHVLSLPSRSEKKTIHDGNRDQLNLPKSHERYHNVVMWHRIVYKWRRSKQRLGFHRTFFSLLDFTVSLSCRHWHSETRWSHSLNQPGGTYCQAHDFLLRTSYTLEMRCANAKVANQVPASPVKTLETLVIRMSWSYRCLEWRERQHATRADKNKLKKWLVIEKSANKCIVPQIFWNYNKINENHRKNKFVNIKQLHLSKVISCFIRDYFFNTVNMCDRGRTITHMQIPRFHTQVWYKILRLIKPIGVLTKTWRCASSKPSRSAAHIYEDIVYKTWRLRLWKIKTWYYHTARY